MIDMNPLSNKELAKELYFKEVSNQKYRENFLNELRTRIVVDRRPDGFCCSTCGKISPSAQAFEHYNRVIFPRGNKHELWLVNSHYDGCYGWD